MSHKLITLTMTVHSPIFSCSSLRALNKSPERTPLCSVFAIFACARFAHDDYGFALSEKGTLSRPRRGLLMKIDRQKGIDIINVIVNVIYYNQKNERSIFQGPGSQRGGGGKRCVLPEPGSPKIFAVEPGAPFFKFLEPWSPSF